MDTIYAYKVSTGFDIITPGTSTVAEFKTIMTVNVRDYSASQTERQVNAFIMSCLVTHPTALSWGVRLTEGSACAEA